MTPAAFLSCLDGIGRRAQGDPRAGVRSPPTPGETGWRVHVARAAMEMAQPVTEIVERAEMSANEAGVPGPLLRWEQLVKDALAAFRRLVDGKPE